MNQQVNNRGKRRSRDACGVQELQMADGAALIGVNRLSQHNEIRVLKEISEPKKKKKKKKIKS